MTERLLLVLAIGVATGAAVTALVRARRAERLAVRYEHELMEAAVAIYIAARSEVLPWEVRRQLLNDYVVKHGLEGCVEVSSTHIAPDDGEDEPTGQGSKYTH